MSKRPAPQPAKWNIGLTPAAKRMLDDIRDQRVNAKLRERINDLVQDPEKQGKPLLGELRGYRSIRAVGQRYRIVYRIEGEKVIVVVVSLGLRLRKEDDKADVYELTQKLIRLGLLG